MEGKRMTQEAKKRAPWRKEIERQADRQTLQFPRPKPREERARNMLDQ